MANVHKTPQELVSSRLKLESISFTLDYESKDGFVYFVSSKDTMSWFLRLPKEEHDNYFGGRETITGIELKEKYSGQ